jgi:hypothetical protein
VSGPERGHRGRTPAVGIAHGRGTPVAGGPLAGSAAGGRRFAGPTARGRSSARAAMNGKLIAGGRP